VIRHLIIGNGPAGVVAAETLRRADAQAEITLIGDEAEPPYSRMAIPYLLSGKIGEAGTYLRKDADHFERLRIKLVHGPPRRSTPASRPSPWPTAEPSPGTGC